MSIEDIRGFIKSLPPARKRDGFMVLLIILVALGAFALGRLSTSEHSPLTIGGPASVGSTLMLDAPDVVPSKTNSLPISGSTGSVVASKTGTKYFFPWCGSAGSIKEENKIWFDSPEQARTSGFTPAGNCKGLR